MPGPDPYFDDGQVRIYHGDARELAPQVLEPDSVGCIFADPPYGHNNRDGDFLVSFSKAMGYDQRRNRVISNDGGEASELLDWLIDTGLTYLVPGGALCVCQSGGGGETVSFAEWTVRMHERMRWKHAVIWDKRPQGLGWHYKRQHEMVLIAERPGPSRWFRPKAEGGMPNVVSIFRKPLHEDHPTPKPIELVREIVRNHAGPGELIVDPFLCGGTTLRAAKDLGLRGVGFELEEAFCELSAKRMEQEGLFRAGEAHSAEQGGLF